MGMGFIREEPVSQRIWTPRGYGPPGPYQLADLDPYGTYPLADMYPLPRNWTPLKLTTILKRFAVECAWKFRRQFNLNYDN
jgi:hypothetical protein